MPEAPKNPRTNALLLTKEETQKLSAGIDTALKIRTLPAKELEKIFVNPGSVVATTPVVEAVAAVVIAAVKIYNATKFNELEHISQLPIEKLRGVQIKPEFNIDQLVKARDAINKLK